MSSPLASDSSALSLYNERKASDEIGPGDIIRSKTNHALSNQVDLPVSQHIGISNQSRTPEEGQSTASGSEEVASSTYEIVKPRPAYQAYTPADRKSTNASLQDSTISSPFLIPSYDRPSSAKRISANIGPYDFTSSPFSRVSYGSSGLSRGSRHLAPDENPATQHVFSDRRTSDEGDSATVGTSESAPDQTTVTQMSLGPSDWDSSGVSPGAANPIPADEVRTSTINDYAAGGAIDTANPFFTSTNPFAKKPEKPGAASATEQVLTRPVSTSYRTSRNFSKKLSNIMVPESGTSVSEPTPMLPSAAMADTPMQTPKKTSFTSICDQRTSRLSSVAINGLTTLSEKDVQLDSGAYGNPTPLSSRQPSTIGNNRRTSTAGPPSALDNRRSSLAGPRRSSVSVTNVVIPAHLMTHIETSWSEDKVVGRRKSAYQREDSRSSFNVQSMAQQQQEEVKNIIKMTPQAPRHMSTSMEALAQADPFAAMRERQASARKSRGKSLAAVSEAEKVIDEESESPVSPSEPPEVLTPWNQFAFRYRDADVSPGAGVDPADPIAAAGASLGLGTTNNINDSSAAPRRPSIWRRSATADVQNPYNGERRGTVFQRANSVFQDTLLNVRKKVRRSSMWDVYENAKRRQLEIRRKRWVQIVFEYSFYAMLLALLYFLIIGVPLWKGTYLELYLAFKYKLNVTGSWSIVIAVSVAYAYSPLLVLFEPDPPMPDEPIDATKTPNVSDTALMIPCYKAANLIGPTLEAATKIFPPSHIFVVANGNSPTPLDNTEEICRPFGVNHIWSPVGSKIVAQFVGCYAAKDFKNVLLIDDDCALPPNFPIVSDRLKGKVMCMGYTIKSVGPKSSKGTLCQQAQDLEYKISGIQRALAGKIGSATFPHGAISLWDREFLIKTFSKHPGFSVSEDWFFGHVARQLGCRTQMATSVFIETETPDAVFFSSGGERGGFGEMTVFKQRFYRWNFFFVNGMYYNLHYILFSWKLGWWELGAKLFVFQEIYETLLYLATPIVVPVSLAVRPQFFFELMALTFVLYMANAVIFNELHLRRKNEKVPQKCVWLYYMPYKLVLTFVNVASCYYAIYKYATYFATRHPKIIEDDKAVNVVLQLEEEDVNDDPVLPAGGRRMSVTAVGSQVEVPGGAVGGRRMTITAMGQRFSNPDITEEDEEEAAELVEKPERKASISIIKSGDALTPMTARRPSITVGGRRVSVTSATVIDEVPMSKQRRRSDAFQSKGITAPVVDRRPSDTFRAKGIDDYFAQTPRRGLSAGKISTIGVTSVLEEAEEEEEETLNEKKPTATADVETKRRSKRVSLLRQPSFAPVVEVTETEFVPKALDTSAVVDDRLLSCISAIEEALAARGIGAVDFAVHDDGAMEAATADEEEEEENEDFVSIAEDEKKHSDAKSMV
ncbi:hypothetical protein QM012_006555 [Aureobasidium pullulans]|uniref:Glycosyltransferase family 2 protein n=1 Tax=Aureobasidium pullulans TaxID=5580 RepID=A0ABR0TQC6_AURPU